MIWEKAEELGRLIGQTSECKALRRAETILREDQETVQKLDTIQRLAKQVDEPGCRPAAQSDAQGCGGKKDDAGAAREQEKRSAPLAR